ncbi:hypothetical protein [Parasitella parasitica]|uniref:Uncharacterized protein n=1 Tax=Parasitella parasitica TaxID=35722 RepID=A0A0B7N699_9FUNG|nr:hypothetical protein [Parasitella parasitica]
MIFEIAMRIFLQLHIKSPVEEKEDPGYQRPLMRYHVSPEEEALCKSVFDLFSLPHRMFLKQKEIPSLHQSILGTPIFHAFDHSMHCQCDFNLRYLTGAGLNDGEGIERFWSEFAELTRLTRNMPEANRSLTPFCAVQHQGKKKIFALELQTVIRAEILQNGDNVLQLRETWEEYAAAQRVFGDMLATLPFGCVNFFFLPMRARTERGLETLEQFQIAISLETKYQEKYLKMSTSKIDVDPSFKDGKCLLLSNYRF